MDLPLGPDTQSKRTHIEISETAKLRRLYVLAALKTDTLTDLKQAISDVWRRTNRTDQPPDYVSVYRSGNMGDQLRTKQEC
jgi:hypothetical protein